MAKHGIFPQSPPLKISLARWGPHLYIFLSICVDFLRTPQEAGFDRGEEE